MARKQQPLTKVSTFAWLHGGAEPIVYYTLRKVDGARLPYTAAMLERAALRNSVSILSLDVDTDCKQLPKAS